MVGQLATQKQHKHTMASIWSRARNSSVTRITKKYEVYVAAVPLRAPKGPTQLLMSTIYSLNLFNLQHFMVIMNSSSIPEKSHDEANIMVCDFQPEDPEDIFTAVAALSGQKIRGIVLTRKLKKLPKRKCWLVGCSELDSLEGVYRFNENWETDLRIGFHDCRNYVNELVEFLTGEKLVLNNLKI
ncbi:hypothetical protein ACH5RR_034531 [Cinchona calisaya]|uniref:Uncharacterized protein n=1 Tax=Cinchona calisaya TaxID=153742 RepID=A0ABD2YES8_9GENT